MSEQKNAKRFPKLHNAMWPGLVGKGSPGAEPCIDLDTMLDLTARAQVNGLRFDGVDLFLSDPHISIDLDRAGAKALADKLLKRNFVAGSVVAPVWGGTGGGSAMGGQEDRKKFLEQVRKACRIASWLREFGARPYGVVRIDSATGVEEWSRDPEANQKRIAETFSLACDIAEGFGESLAAEGEICWGGMHSWKHMLDLLERVGRPETLGFQADMAHTLLYLLGHNAPGHALLPADWKWSDPGVFDAALARLADALRPWTIDFHVAQNDATVHGSGTHDTTGHHCLPSDPAGKLDIPRHAGYWLRDKLGNLTKRCRHICWDGCMFSNQSMMRQETWNEILATMAAVRNAHGWNEDAVAPKSVSREVLVLSTKRPGKTAGRKKRGKTTPQSRKRTGKQQNKNKTKKTMSAKKAKAAKKPAKKAAKKKGKK